MSPFANYRRAAATFLAVTMVVTGLAVTNSLPGDDPQPAEAQPAQAGQRYPTRYQGQWMYWYPSQNRWGRYDRYTVARTTHTDGVANFRTPDTLQNPISLPARQMNVAGQPRGTNEHGFVDREVNNTRGWLVDRNTTRLQNPANGQWFNWRPQYGNSYFDQQVYSGAWARQPNGRHRIPWAHNGLYTGTRNFAPSGYPYVCYFARWCFYGHNPERAEFGRFLHHNETWPFRTRRTTTTSTIEWRFTPCPASHCRPLTNSVSVLPPQVGAAGWAHGQVRLDGSQPITISSRPLRCVNSQGQTVNAPNCGVRPPSAATLRNQGAGPRTFTWGPFVQSVDVLRAEVVAPQGFSAGPNPQVNQYQVLRPFNLGEIASATSGAASTVSDLRFFQPTTPGAYFEVDVQLRVTFATRSRTWDGNAFTGPERFNASQTRNATLTCEGFEAAGSNRCRFTVVGSALD